MSNGDTLDVKGNGNQEKGENKPSRFFSQCPRFIQRILSFICKHQAKIIIALTIGGFFHWLNLKPSITASYIGIELYYTTSDSTYSSTQLITMTEKDEEIVEVERDDNELTIEFSIPNSVPREAKGIYFTVDHSKIDLTDSIDDDFEPGFIERGKTYIKSISYKKDKMIYSAKIKMK